MNSGTTSSRRSRSGGRRTVRPSRRASRSGAEAPGARRLHQRVLPGDDHPHVDRHRPRLAQRLDLTLLEHAQQLRLQRKRQIRHLVEQQRPPSALRKNPGLARSAPVNAPRRWPNSSLSASPSGSAAQFTATSGPVRPLHRWSAPAAISLPVPVSPSSTIGRSLVAARCRGASAAASAPPPQTPGRDLAERAGVGRDDSDPAAEPDDVARSERRGTDQPPVDPDTVAAPEVGDEGAPASSRRRAAWRRETSLPDSSIAQDGSRPITRSPGSSPASAVGSCHRGNNQASTGTVPALAGLCELGPDTVVAAHFGHCRSIHNTSVLPRTHRRAARIVDPASRNDAIRRLFPAR